MRNWIRFSGASGRRWYVVLVLCVLYVLSYVDRMILVIIAPGVSASLGLSDTQLGLLIGTAFALLYATIGVPIAQWMDARDRRWGIVAGVLLWSAATGASGLATGFGSLLVLRAGVAIGEAVLTPAAVSLIADLFPANRRTLPMSIYAAVGAMMNMGALILGGFALRIAETFAPTYEVEAWRVVFFLLGGTGTLLAILFAMTVREPTRIIEPADPTASVQDFLVYLRQRGAFYIPFLLGSGLATMFGLSLASWAPMILVRGHGLEPADAASFVGSFGLVAGLVGTLLWPGFAALIDRRRPGRGPIYGLTTASILAFIFVFFPMSATPLGVGIGVAGTMGCLAAWGALPPLLVQYYAPGRMRARIVSLHLLCVSGIGYALGPPLAASLGEMWGADRGLAIGLVICGTVTVPAAIVCYLLCVRAMSRLARDT